MESRSSQSQEDTAPGGRRSILGTAEVDRAAPARRGRQTLAMGASRSMRRLMVGAPATVNWTWATVDRPEPSRAVTVPTP